jgi:hypothetical protein
METKFMPCDNHLRGECPCTSRCVKFEREHKKEERMRDVKVKRVLAHLNGESNTLLDWAVRLVIAFAVLLTFYLLVW